MSTVKKIKLDLLYPKKIVRYIKTIQKVLSSGGRVSAMHCKK